MRTPAHVLSPVAACADSVSKRREGCCTSALLLGWLRCQERASLRSPLTPRRAKWKCPRGRRLRSCESATERLRLVSKRTAHPIERGRIPLQRARQAIAPGGLVTADFDQVTKAKPAEARWRAVMGSAYAPIERWRASADSLREKPERRLVSRLGIEPRTRRLRDASITEIARMGVFRSDHCKARHRDAT